MGIKNLFQFLKKKYPVTIQEGNLSYFSGMKLAIDATGFAYTYKRIGEKWIEQFVYLICTLKRNKIHPIFVFDGEAPELKRKYAHQERKKSRDKTVARLALIDQLIQDIELYQESDIVPPVDQVQEYLEYLEKYNKSVISSPVNKLELDDEISDNITSFTDLVKMESKFRNEQQKLQKQTQYLTAEDVKKLMKIIKSVGMPTFIAPSEAETMCAWMCIHGMVQAVVSSDSDVLAYGTPFLITKLQTSTGKCDIISIDLLLSELEMTQSQFTDMCIMSGCDYNTNIEKVGIVGAMKYIKQYHNIETISQETNLDVSCLNYQECRQLFSTPKKLNIEYPHLTEYNEQKFKKYLFKHNCYISKTDLELWKPTELDFEI